MRVDAKTNEPVTRPLVLTIMVAGLFFTTASIVPCFSQMTAREAVAKDPRGQYAIIKKLIDPRLTGKYPTGRERDNLGTCGDMELELGILPATLKPAGKNALNKVASSAADARTEALVHLAGLFYKWEHELPKLGYPREISLPLIIEVERRLLDHVVAKGGDDFQDTLDREGTRLARRLNATAAQRHLRTTKVFFEDACGGGGMLTRFRIPKGVHFFLTSDFYVRLCKAQERDPLDLSTCTYWEELSDGQQKMLAGYYHCVAEWPNGEKRTARFNAESANGVFRLAK